MRLRGRGQVRVSPWHKLNWTRRGWFHWPRFTSVSTKAGRYSHNSRSGQHRLRLWLGHWLESDKRRR